METVEARRSLRAAAGGMEFHYLEWGGPDAPAMVLLHGLTGHAHTWDHVARALADRYHLFAPDQRGHGDSAHAASYATTDFTRDLAALVKLWQLERFVLIGLSMGGHNAMAYAVEHPEQVSRLIVVDIGPRLRREQAPNRQEMVTLARTGHRPFATFDEAFSAARAANTTAPDAMLRDRTRWNLRQTDAGLLLKYDAAAPARWDPADLTDALPRIGAPTLVVRGGKTQVLPPQVADEMVAAIPDAELVEVPDSGHSVPTDRPDDLARVVAEWLARRR